MLQTSTNNIFKIQKFFNVLIHVQRNLFLFQMSPGNLHDCLFHNMQKINLIFKNLCFEACIAANTEFGDEGGGSSVGSLTQSAECDPISKKPNKSINKCEVSAHLETAYKHGVDARRERAWSGHCRAAHGRSGTLGTSWNTGTQHKC